MAEISGTRGIDNAPAGEYDMNSPVADSPDSPGWISARTGGRGRVVGPATLRVAPLLARRGLLPSAGDWVEAVTSSSESDSASITTAATDQLVGVMRSGRDREVIIDGGAGLVLDGDTGVALGVGRMALGGRVRVVVDWRIGVVIGVGGILAGHRVR